MGPGPCLTAQSAASPLRRGGWSLEQGWVRPGSRGSRPRLGPDSRPGREGAQGDWPRSRLSVHLPRECPPPPPRGRAWEGPRVGSECRPLLLLLACRGNREPFNRDRAAAPPGGSWAGGEDRLAMLTLRRPSCRPLDPSAGRTDTAVAAAGSAEWGRGRGEACGREGARVGGPQELGRLPFSPENRRPGGADGSPHQAPDAPEPVKVLGVASGPVVPLWRGGGLGRGLCPRSAPGGTGTDRGRPAREGPEVSCSAVRPAGMWATAVPQGWGALPEATRSTWPFSPPRARSRCRARPGGLWIPDGPGVCPASLGPSPPLLWRPMRGRTGSHLAQRLPEEASEVMANLPAPAWSGSQDWVSPEGRELAGTLSSRPCPHGRSPRALGCLWNSLSLTLILAGAPDPGTPGQDREARGRGGGIRQRAASGRPCGACGRRAWPSSPAWAAGHSPLAAAAKDGPGRGQPAGPQALRPRWHSGSGGPGTVCSRSAVAAGCWRRVHSSAGALGGTRAPTKAHTP